MAVISDGDRSVPSAVTSAPPPPPSDAPPTLVPSPYQRGARDRPVTVTARAAGTEALTTQTGSFSTVTTQRPVVGAPEFRGAFVPR